MSSSSILSAINTLRGILTREEKFKWLGIVFFALTTSLFEVVTASVIVVFAQVLNQPEMGQKYTRMLGLNDGLPHSRIIFYMALTVGGIYVLKNIIAGAEVFYQNFSIQKMNYQFKNKMLYRYADADYGFYLTRNSHQGYYVIAGDIQLMFTNGMTSIAIILSESMVFACMVSLMIWMNPSLALILFGLGSVLALFVTKLMLPRFYKFGQSLQEASLQGGKHLLQFFHAYKEVVLLGKREALIDAFQQHSQVLSRTTALQTAVGSLPRMVIETMFVGLFVTTIAVLCFEHESPVAMLGLLSGYLYAGFRLMPGLNRMVQQLGILKSMIPYVNRASEEYHTVAAKESYINVPDLTFNTSISVQSVSFRYVNTKRDALKDVNLTIKKGECIGIVGETGSGKSTLVDVLLGLLKPYKGSVLVDDQFPVNSYQWHKKIGYVPQSIYLIDDTIAANIAFGEALVDEKKLNAAIDAAQLRKFIDQLPDGAQTIVGERGIRLSGGERQRIAIARALYREPEVLIFDEATSALDNETEARLMETIHAVSQDRTVIMIAHRLSTLKGCDRVVRVSSGITQNDIKI